MTVGIYGNSLLLAFVSWGRLEIRSSPRRGLWFWRNKEKIMNCYLGEMESGSIRKMYVRKMSSDSWVALRGHQTLVNMNEKLTYQQVVSVSTSSGFLCTPVDKRVEVKGRGGSRGTRSSGNSLHS